MLTEKQQTGNAGEELARNYLLEQGYTILENNWQYGHLEVDIIAQENDTIVFVEVKTRTTAAFGSPEQAVTKQKQRNIIRAANSYVLKHNLNNEVRFDIIAIVQNQLQHFKDAYSPLW